MIAELQIKFCSKIMNNFSTFKNVKLYEYKGLYYGPQLKTKTRVTVYNRLDINNVEN